MKKVSKWLTIMLAIVMVASVSLVGCGDETTSGTDDKPATEQHLKLNARVEPPSLDPGTATDSTSFEILRVLQEGLVRLDPNGKVVKGSGMAEDWKISDDLLTYTFTLKDDVKWSNGDPVTAQDFEYAWKRVLDPNTAADYAYQLYYIKNGEKFNSGEGTIDEVGVKALNDTTLEVNLEAPTPYFLQLTAFGSLYPVNKNVAEANSDWGASADTYVSNGPFMLDNWAHDDEVVVVKNPGYWNEEAVKLDKITWIMVNDENTEYQLFQNGDLHKAIPPSDLTLELIEDGKAHSIPILGTYYMTFNTEKEPFSNANIRKAFAAAIDRDAIVESVTRGGQIPAYAFVPPGSSTDLPKDVRDVNGDLVPPTSEAKAYLELGMEELGITEFPTVTYSYNTSEGHKKIAEAAASMWKENLGVEVKLFNQEWKVYLDTMGAGDYEIGRMGWLGDYYDPMTFLDLFTSYSGNNYPQYNSTEYDDLIAQAKATGDQQKRLDAMAAAEKLLIEEDMAVMPVYYYTTVYMEQDNLKDVVRHGDGATDYTWAYLK